MNTTPRSGVIIRQEQRRLRVAELRRSGATLEAIAAELGVSSRTVQRDVDRLLAGVRDDQRSEIDAWRTDALDDLRSLSERMWIELDRDPSPQAVAALAGALVRTIERCSSLLGLDAPQRHVIASAGAEHGSITELYERLPVKAIERARTEMHAQFDEAIRRRQASDEARLAETRNRVTPPDA